MRGGTLPCRHRVVSGRACSSDQRRTYYSPTHGQMVVVATAGAVGVGSTTPGVEQHGRAEVGNPGCEGIIKMPVGETGEGDAADVEPSPPWESPRQGLEKVVPIPTAPRKGQEAASESVHGDRPGPPVAGAGKDVAVARSLIGGPESSWCRPRDRRTTSDGSQPNGRQEGRPLPNTCRHRAGGER